MVDTRYIGEVGFTIYLLCNFFPIIYSSLNLAHFLYVFSEAQTQYFLVIFTDCTLLLDIVIFFAFFLRVWGFACGLVPIILGFAQVCLAASFSTSIVRLLCLVNSFCLLSSATTTLTTLTTFVKLAFVSVVVFLSVLLLLS
jgi:hypothetical protein